MKNKFSRLLVTAFCGGLLLAGTTGCFRVSSETAMLRDAVLQNTPTAEWEEQIEIGLGRISFAVVQLGGAVAARFVDLPPEARTVLNSAKGANASVYHRKGGSLDDFNPQKVLAQADKNMEKRGWYRLVGVLRERELVAVYVPEDVDLARDAEVCVLVVNESELVCAGARSDLRPLYALGMEKAKEQFPELAASRPN